MELDAPEIQQDIEDLEYWIVGGAVRDKMLDKEPEDRDYVVIGAKPREMKERGFKPIEASNFPVFQDSNGDEWALARKERKIGEGYHGFETFTDDVTLEEDLARRDFTINAIAYNPEEDIHDYPVAVKGNREAHSIRDLNQGIIRHITEAFEEDPVRILRMARFASRLPGFDIADDTMIIAQENSHRLENVPGERIGSEVRKAMKQAEEPTRFFEVLRESKALEFIMPKIAEFEDISAGPEEHHGEGDLWSHTMMVIEEANKLQPNSVELLLMALVHDIGKVKTQDEDNTGGHDKLGVGLVEQFAENLKLSNDLTEKLKDASREHMRIFKVNPFQENSMRESKVIELVQRLDGGKGATQEELVNLAMADNLGRITDNKVDLTAFKRIDQRIEIAREVIDEVDAEYVADKRGKEIEDFEGENLGQTILNDRVHRMKEIQD